MRIHIGQENRIFHKDLISPLRIGAEGEERPHQVLCYRSGGKNGKLDMEEEGRVKNLKLAYLLHLSNCFSGRLGWPVSRECLLELVVEIPG